MVPFYEQVLNMGEESEDEDFEAAATKRVNEAISSILIEEEEETGATVVEIEAKVVVTAEQHVVATCNHNAQCDA